MNDSEGMDRIIVVGAGPAGMMAAIKAAENGARALLLEKMAAPGRKLLITGKGRCNITNAAEKQELIKNIPGNGRFLYSSLKACDNEDVQLFFQGLGVPVKVERGGRVFPVSDRAADVVEAMVLRLRELGVQLVTDAKVAELLWRMLPAAAAGAPLASVLPMAVFTGAGPSSLPQEAHPIREPAPQGMVFAGRRQPAIM